MKKRLYIGAILFAANLIVSSLFAQSLDALWIRTYFNENRDGGDVCVAGAQFGDSILLAGDRGDSTGSDFMLMWINRDGDCLDTMIYCTPDYNEGTYSAFLTPRQTVVVCGLVTTDPDSSFAAELTLDGNIAWYQLFYRPATPGLQISCLTTDGNYVFAGSITVPLPQGGNDRRFWIVRMDSTGQVLSDRVVDSDPEVFSTDDCSCIIATSAGGVIVGCDSWDGYTYIYKLNSQDITVWGSRIGRPTAFDTRIEHIVELTDHDFVCVGSIVHPEFGTPADLLVIRCDSLSHQRWLTSPHLDQEQVARRVILSREGNLIVCGSSNREGRAPDTFIASLDQSGMIRRLNILDTNLDTWTKNILQLSDSTFVVVGGGLPHVIGLGHPGFYAARFSPDRYIPAPPEPFDLISPIHGDTMSLGSIEFIWSQALDPDFSDTVRYELHISNDAGEIIHENIADTSILITTQQLTNLGGANEFSWEVHAHSTRPDTTIRSRNTGSFSLQNSNAVDSDLPLNYDLTPTVFPNPFNSQCTIRFSIPPYCSQADLILYNLLGQQVSNTTFHNPSGTIFYSLDASNLSTGVYLLHVQAGTLQSTQKLMVLK